MDESTKYREIAADLQGKIDSGDLEAGAKLPSDAELSDEYDASRNTVREAIRILVNRGSVEKRASQGAFVSPKVDPFSTIVSIDTGFGGFEGAAYASDVTARNREPTVNTPRVEIQKAPPGIAVDLELGEDSTVVVRHQQRFIDGVLWSIQTSYYPLHFVTDGAARLLEVEDIEEGVRQYLDRALGVKEIGSRDTMKVRAPNSDEAGSFKIPDDGWVSVFETRQIGVDASGMRVRVTITIYPADRNEFSMETGALPSEPQPEAGA